MRGIADYEFLRQLGFGSRGRYFLARRPPRLSVEGDVVAVKVFAPESTSETFRRAVARLRPFNTVRSPYLAGCYDVGQHDGVFYTSMEFLASGSLACPTQPVPLALRIRAVGDAARALSALHLAGIVHGAVKPGNVLLDPYGAKLADPDLTDLFAPGLRHQGRTATTAIVFADPAHLLGAPPAPEHDVWSVGLLLHWVVTGATGYRDLPPCDGLATLRGVVAGTPVPDPALPESVAAVVRDCLAGPADRPSAAAVAQRVAAIAAGIAGHGPIPG